MFPAWLKVEYITLTDGWLYSFLVSCVGDATAAALVTVHDNDIVMRTGIVSAFSPEQESAWPALPECVVCAAESYVYLDSPYVRCDMCLGVSAPELILGFMQELFEFVSENIFRPDGVPQ